MAFLYFEGENGPLDVVEEHRRRVRHQILERIHLRDTQNPFEMSVTEFICLYRMPQHKVRMLVEMLRPLVARGRIMTKLSLETKVLTALAFYASGGYQRVTGRMSDLNVCQSSVSNIIEEITGALNHPQILRRFIHFPDSAEEVARSIAINDRLGMPRTLGYIDGTLVKIVPPPKNNNRHLFFCRKGYAAVNVQIVCDANLRILNVNARHPGSATDAFIWGASAARAQMVQCYNDHRCWLLGDSGYPEEPWLHVPLPHAEPGTPEYWYTRAHCHSRNVVERCIGILKARWRCLLWDRTLHYSPEKCGQIVNACVVLHNFCIRENVRDPPPEYEPNRLVPDEDDVYDVQLNIAELADRERMFLIEYVNIRRQHEED